MKKMQALSSSDKSTIDQQQKKLNETRRELEDLKVKFGSLKRNYESVSTYAAKDNVEYNKVKEMTDRMKREI
jgi:hypothetical protein